MRASLAAARRELQATRSPLHPSRRGPAHWLDRIFGSMFKPPEEAALLYMGRAEVPEGICISRSMVAFVSGNGNAPGCCGANAGTLPPSYPSALLLEEALTDGDLTMFEKLMASLGRSAERKTDQGAARSVREVQGDLRVFALSGRALIEAPDGARISTAPSSPRSAGSASRLPLCMPRRSPGWNRRPHRRACRAPATFGWPARVDDYLLPRLTFEALTADWSVTARCCLALRGPPCRATHPTR